jgi:hypothetical protein
MAEEKYFGQEFNDTRRSHGRLMESWNVGWDILKDPKIHSVLLVGCGGGFDFVHSLLIYDDLINLGKEIYVGSYSFGDPRDYSATPSLEPIFSHPYNKNPTSDILSPVVYRISSKCSGSKGYCPELGYCSYLDQRYPSKSPHEIYAYYARSFTVQTLTQFYSQLIASHGIDVVIAIDGGSDSLMRGDEHGLGDPIEDAVSVAAIASLCCSVVSYQEAMSRPIPSPSSEESLSPTKPLGLLYSVGFGCDRFNFVSDASSLRAVAELTASGGFLGSFSLTPASRRVAMYREGLAHIYQQQEMRSILSGCILASSLGGYGNDFQSSSLADFGTRLPPSSSVPSPGRPSSEEIFLWPLMSMLWMFDITVVAERSMICQWIAPAVTPRESGELLDRHRKVLHSQQRIRSVEHLPTPRGAVASETEGLERGEGAQRDGDEGAVKKCLVS